jgi:serine/threonine-protein kinase RIO1
MITQENRPISDHKEARVYALKISDNIAINCYNTKIRNGTHFTYFVKN